MLTNEILRLATFSSSDGSSRMEAHEKFHYKVHGNTFMWVSKYVGFLVQIQKCLQVVHAHESHQRTIDSYLTHDL